MKLNEDKCHFMILGDKKNKVFTVIIGDVSYCKGSRTTAIGGYWKHESQRPAQEGRKDHVHISSAHYLTSRLISSDILLTLLAP